MASDARAAKRRASKPNSGAPEAKAPEVPPAPPAVTVVLAVDQAGSIAVGDVKGENGVRVSELQFWLEEGIKYVRRALNKP